MSKALAGRLGSPGVYRLRNVSRLLGQLPCCAPNWSPFMGSGPSPSAQHLQPDCGLAIKRWGVCPPAPFEFGLVLSLGGRDIVSVPPQLIRALLLVTLGTFCLWTNGPRPPAGE